MDQIITHQLNKGPAYGDLAAENLQAHFHTKFGIPLQRILLHPSNIPDPVARSAARGNYGDVILGIPASPFPEFIDAFVQEEIIRISTEWRLASSLLKDERAPPSLVPPPPHPRVQVHVLVQRNRPGVLTTVGRLPD